jgi:aspartyl/asparaginyl beta-hydroxylase (cupin superfamily)
MPVENNIWYSFFGGELKDNAAWFESADFAWAKAVEKRSPAIQKEIRLFISQNEKRLLPYFNKNLVSSPKQWKALSFRFWNYSFRKNQEKIPNTMKILSEIPHLVSVSISMLEPKTEIKPHRGDTNAIIRCHLPITIPKPLPHCGMQVGDAVKGWEEGKLLLFCDAARHLAWNRSEERRFILLFDVIRPEFAKYEMQVCANVLTSLLWQYIIQKMTLLERSPGWLKRLFHSTLKPLVRLVLHFRS